MQASFKDGCGRTWAIDSPFDFPTIHRVRQLSGIDLLSITRGMRPLPAADPSRTVLALWAIVKPYAQHGGISVTEFTQSMQAPELQSAAVAAVLEALIPNAPPQLHGELHGTPIE